MFHLSVYLLTFDILVFYISSKKQTEFSLFLFLFAYELLNQFKWHTLLCIPIFPFPKIEPLLFSWKDVLPNKHNSPPSWQVHSCGCCKQWK